MCQDEIKRMIIKQGSGVPTIPVSSDHRNGDWLDTDIYEGELYMDTDTGIVYSRYGSSTIVASEGIKFKYSATISQAGTAAPVATIDFDNFGSIVLARSSIGIYTLTMNGAFAANKTKVFIGTPRVVLNTILAYRQSTDIVKIETYDATGALADDILSEQALTIELFP